MATEQEIRNAERRAENLTRNGAVTSFSVPPRSSTTSGFTSMVPSIPASPEVEAFVRGSGNAFFGSPSTRPPTVPAPTGGGGAGSGGAGGGSSQGMTAEQALALAKFNYEKQQDANKLSGLQNYFNSGSFNKTFDNLLKMIETQGQTSRGDIGKAYERATTGIDEGYGVAQNLGDEGYRVLNAYLTANQNNPYAGLRAQVGSAPDALTDYLSAYGVSDLPVRGQIEADQLQAQQGAGNFQNLIDVLNSIAQQGAGSRAAESQMAQLVFNTALGQDRAGYRSQAENAQAQALAQLAAQIAERQFGVESNRGTVSQQLAQAVAELGGNTGSGSSSGGGSNNSSGGGGSGGGSSTNNNNLDTMDIRDRGPLPGQLAQTATPQEIVANQLANLLVPAQAQNTTAQELLAELNARRGR